VAFYILVNSIGAGNPNSNVRMGYLDCLIHFSIKTSYSLAKLG